MTSDDFVKIFYSNFTPNIDWSELQEILYEHPLIGFEVDVIDKALCYPLECGDTNPFKLEQYLTAESVRKMIVLPYPLQGNVFAFIFTPSSKFKDYVVFKQDYLRNKIQKR